MQTFCASDLLGHDRSAGIEAGQGLLGGEGIDLTLDDQRITLGHEGLLDGVGLEDALDIRLGDAGSRERVVLLGGVDVIKGRKRRLRPENEAAWVRAWGQL